MPITIAQEFGAWSSQLDSARMRIEDSLRLMRESFRGPDLAEALLAKAAGRPPDFGPA